MSNSYLFNKIIVDYKDVIIRFSEVDSLGILWHGNYVQFFEDGREAFGEKYGLSYLSIRDHGYFVPVTKLELHFKKYVKYGTLLEVETTFHYTKSAKIVFSYKILIKHTKETVCTGKSEQVFVNAQTYQLASQNHHSLKNGKPIH